MSAPNARASRSGCLALLGPVYPFRGGIAQHTTLLAQAIEQAGASLSVISFRRLYPRLLYPGQSDRDPSGQPLQIEARYLLDSVDPLSWERTTRAIAALRPERVIVPWWTSFLGPALGWTVRRLARQGIPSLYLVHNVLPHEPGRLDRPLARYALGAGRGFVVQSQRERDRLSALLPGARAVVCPHPVYNQFTGQRVGQRQARRALNLPEDGRLALFFGFVRPYKGLEVLLEALAALDQDGERVDLLVAGEFWQSSAGTRARIAELGLQDRVHLLDRYIPNEQVSLIFSAADLFAAPYLSGTQSGALKMALGFGLPAVISDAIAEELPPAYQQRVRVVPAGDAAALAQGLRATLDEQAAVRAPLDTAPSGWADLARTVMTLPL